MAALDTVSDFGALDTVSEFAALDTDGHALDAASDVPEFEFCPETNAKIKELHEIVRNCLRCNQTSKDTYVELLLFQQPSIPPIYIYIYIYIYTYIYIYISKS